MLKTSPSAIVSVAAIVGRFIPVKASIAKFIIPSALVAAMYPGVAYAMEIKTPAVSMPHINVPHVTTPQVNTHLNTPQLNTHVITPGDSVNKTSKTTGLQKQINTTVGAGKTETVGGATTTTIGTGGNQTPITPPAGAVGSQGPSETSTNPSNFNPDGGAGSDLPVQAGSGTVGGINLVPNTGPITVKPGEVSQVGQQLQNKLNSLNDQSDEGSTSLQMTK